MGQVAELFRSRFWPPGCNAPETEESGGLCPTAQAAWPDGCHDCVGPVGTAIAVLAEQDVAWRRSHDVR